MRQASFLVSHGKSAREIETISRLIRENGGGTHTHTHTDCEQNAERFSTACKLHRVPRSSRNRLHVISRSRETTGNHGNGLRNHRENPALPAKPRISREIISLSKLIYARASAIV